MYVDVVADARPFPGGRGEESARQAKFWRRQQQVLACCIVVVVLSGLAKLWWTNRSMRKLETMDEEKRARALEMRHCGIAALHGNSVPFGVRALQSGIEVDGIWVSRPNTPEHSHGASSAPLVGGQTGGRRDPTKWTGSSGEGQRGDEMPGNSPAGPLVQSRRSPPAQVAREGRPEGRRPDDEAVVESGTPTCQREPRQHGEDGGPVGGDGSGSGALVRRPHVGMASSRGRNPPGLRRPAGRVAHCGPAEVYANRDVRQPNQDFHVLPTGLLGPRQELAAPPRRPGEPDERKHDAIPGPPTGTAAKPARLRKKAPRGR